MKNQPFTRRLAHAAGGIRSTFRTETSFRTQLLLAVALAGVLALLRPHWYGPPCASSRAGWCSPRSS
jgi:diacylglycerol kinase